ncbi:MAG: MATE family efflux transporter [Clostridia bacterium]|nr:MATE family efflux transporter [Clostridia bacterium]
MAIISRDKKFYKSLFSLAGVIAVQNLVVFSVNLADNIMIGRWSELSLSAVAICNQIQFLLQMIVTGAAGGLVVIASQYWGKKDIQPIKKLTSAAFLIGIGMTLALMLFAMFWPREALGLLTNDAEVIAEGMKYLRIMVWSYVVFGITNILIGALRAVETVNIGFYVSIGALVVNVTLNYALIYGHLGFDAMGIEGAAIATLISRVFELAVVGVYTFCIDKKLRLRILDIFSVSAGYLRDFVRSGLPIVLSNTSWGIAMSVQTAILGRLGQMVISSNSIATTIFQVIIVVSSGLASAVGVVIGKTVGEGRQEDAKTYAKTLQILFLCVGILSSLALFAARKPIIGIYGVSGDTAAMSNTFILILCVTIIGSCYQMPALTGIVSGGGETKFVLFNDIIFQWMIVIPASALSAFIFGFPPAVTFACLKSDQILKCFVAVVKVNRFRWIRVLTK